jgi:hypothetical protein
VSDVKQYHVVKYLDPVKERIRWSGKKKINNAYTQLISLA